MATPNATFTEIVSSTRRLHKTNVVDNVIDQNGLLRLMRKRGNIKTESGGYEIALPVFHSEVGTYQRFSGYDQLDQSSSETMTSAKYDWMQAAINITASGRELRMNSGEEAMIKLVKARKQIAVTTATNRMSIDLYSDGAASNQMGGLSALVTSDGTGTVGGIVSGTYTFWKNKFKEVSGTGATFTTLTAALNEMWQTVNKGAEFPDVLVMSHDFYAIYEAGLQALQRYGNADVGELGFPALKYKSAPVIADTNTNFGTTAEICYVLNTKYLYMIQHEDAHWEPEAERVPTNQDAVVIPMFWMGNMCTDNRRMQAKIIDAS